MVHFLGEEWKEDVLYSIKEHDRAWIDLDHTPLWNDELQRPYSFIDYPSLIKLTYYRQGIDKVGRQSPYAGLLCSLHFASFYEAQKNVQFHFKLLQQCDHLSIYLCMQEPGINKAQEISWYRNGFPQLFSHLKPYKCKRFD